MSAGPVENRNGLLVGAERCGEAVEEDLHRGRADRGTNQGKGGLAVGPGRAEQLREGEAPVLPSGSSLTPRSTAVAKPSLLCSAHLVLEVKDGAPVRVRPRSLAQCVAKPPFSNAFRALAEALGCTGHAFWCDQPLTQQEARQALRRGSAA